MNLAWKGAKLTLTILTKNSSRRGFMGLLAGGAALVALPAHALDTNEARALIQQLATEADQMLSFEPTLAGQESLILGTSGIVRGVSAPGASSCSVSTA